LFRFGGRGGKKLIRCCLSFSFLDVFSSPLSLSLSFFLSFLSSLFLSSSLPLFSSIGSFLSNLFSLPLSYRSFPPLFCPPFILFPDHQILYSMPPLSSNLIPWHFILNPCLIATGSMATTGSPTAIGCSATAGSVDTVAFDVTIGSVTTMGSLELLSDLPILDLLRVFGFFVIAVLLRLLDLLRLRRLTTTTNLTIWAMNPAVIIFITPINQRPILDL